MLERFYKNHSILGTLFRFVKLLTTIVITASVVIITSIIVIYFYFAHDLPNIQNLKDFKPPVVSEVFSDDGTKMGEFWIECRFWLPIQAIPKQVMNGFIAAEDARFFEHRGVDILGIGRAMIENFKAGRIVQGGSTITQQITRSLLLSSERKMARKIKEAILATRIERNLNKQEILELYLNQIFLGNRAYGIKAAARNYFHKQVNELTTAEIAMLAGMPTAPSVDSPVHSIEKAKERQQYVLEKMQQHGFINKQEMKEALAQPFTIHVAGIDKDFNNDFAPYFTEHVRRILLDKYGEDALYKGGLKIYTTADLKMNVAAQKALRTGLEKLDKRQGFRGVLEHTDDPHAFAEKVQKELINERKKDIISIPAGTGEDLAPLLEADKFYKAVITGFEGNKIKILVGSQEGFISHKGFKWARSFNTNSAAYDDANYLDDPKTKFKEGDIIYVKTTEDKNEFSLAQAPVVEGALYSMDPVTGAVRALVGGYDFKRSEFNRATQALRQPGSSFKPFIYSAALDKGYNFTTPVLDAPISYFVGPFQPPWTPKNYDGKFSGVTTFESDIIHSRNVPTVKIANDIGLHYLTAYIRKMGLTTPIGKYLSMALGSNGVYLSEMVPAYSTFASGGITPKPYYIKKITDVNGAVLEEYDTPEKKEADIVEPTKEEAAKMNDLNTELFEAAQKYIEADGLNLTQENLKILYGNVIPEGHTITPQTAYLMTRLLQEVVNRGTATRVKALGRPVAGKTGTTNDETDCWFIGFTPELAAGVWIGFDNIAKIGGKEAGGKTAAPIFLDYMKIATADIPVKDFEPPKGIKADRVSHLSGGSAVYFKGFSMLRRGLAGEHEIKDRAIDFFEEDMSGGGETSY